MCCSFTSKSSCVVKSEDGRNFCFFCFFFSEALFVCFFLSRFSLLFISSHISFFFTPRERINFLRDFKRNSRSFVVEIHTHIQKE
jgi:hypothetical protein